MIDAFVEEMTASGLFVSVEAVPVMDEPRIVDAWADSVAGQEFCVSLVEGQDNARVLCDGYVFEAVPVPVVLEFVDAVVHERIEVTASGNGTRLTLGVPTSQGVWQDTRRVTAEVSPWERQALARKGRGSS
ncbi:hypothetical protein [Streptomyces sp. NRRL S-495]|uniref:hypothetical protein n=1 Tax=Streptomyces sp. NRRL S-495 TaxID=1609133 RepID=UPI0005F9A6D5|nr:hypothetical protein [Streptomyces sp. NRRL S-495]KJY28692.1 hypothetical protein VR45_31755 [Streptomyces sp. NRRL S-495]